MRRAYSSLLSSVTASNLSSRNLLPVLSSPFAPQKLFPNSLFRLKSHFLLPSILSNPFPKCPLCRSIQTLPSIPPSPNPSPLDSFESATATEEILTAFESLESSLGGSDERIGLACLKVGEHLNSTNSGDLSKALIFAHRALKILERNEIASISLAKTLILVGSISCKLKRFDDSMESLTAADRVLDSLEIDGFDDLEVKSSRIEVQLLIAAAKTALGRRWEAMINLRRSLELKKLILKPIDRELGDSYKDLAEAHAAALDFKEALPLCLKAMEIFKAKLGQNSVELARACQLLGIIYVGLGDNEEGLQQNELAQRIMESLGLEIEVLDLEIEAANIKIAMGRFGEAMEMLKGVIQRAGKESEVRALVFISMAKALCGQEKFGDSKRCLEIACGVLDKLEPNLSPKAAEAYAEISMLFEMMNEFETALTLMKRTLAVLEQLPQEQHLEGSILARMGWLLLLTGRALHAVPHLERAAERLKGSFGPKHFGLGFVYKHLGQTYVEMDKPESAVKMLVLAKGIIDVSFGKNHEDSIDTCQCLANAYGAMGSYARAMELQQEVIDGWESHGPNARDELREAHRLLEQLKKKAQGSPSAVFPANALPLPPQK